MSQVKGESDNGLIPGVLGVCSNTLTGVRGIFAGVGVEGIADGANGTGVKGTGDGRGVEGESDTGTGVFGGSKKGFGVYGINDFPKGGSLKPDYGVGVCGESTNGFGVFGSSDNNIGIKGVSVNQTGVFGSSEKGIGVFGQGKLAGRFEGDVEVTGDIRIENADVAEDFFTSSTDTAEPGTVMILGKDGMVCPSHHAYDKRVAGVVSGAGNYKPAIVLDKAQAAANRATIALVGKVYCKVDASFGAIEVGDLLTTSPTVGYAMKASDPTRAFGTVIGKALKAFTQGQGLIPILIALQ